jgi:diacylglycerol kinase family enzyme
VRRARLIVNPKATTTSARARDVLIHALRSDLDLEVTETTHRGHARTLAMSARSTGVDLVVGLGGDGTVNEIVNGLLADGPGVGVPKFALVPGGSTNVFARAVGLSDDQVEATGQILEALREGRSRRIGLGRADDRWFTFTAGLGLDAEVVASVEERRAQGRRSTHSLYVRSAVGRFFGGTERHHGPLTLTVDGAEPLAGLFLVLVGNTSPWTFLGRLRVDPFPDASFDADLDVLALSRLSVGATLLAAGQILTPNGQVPWGKSVVHRHDVAHFVVRADPPVAFQVDGDYLGVRSRVDFTAVPQALDVVV